MFPSIFPCRYLNQIEVFESRIHDRYRQSCGLQIYTGHKLELLTLTPNSNSLVQYHTILHTFRLRKQIAWLTDSVLAK